MPAAPTQSVIRARSSSSRSKRRRTTSVPARSSTSLAVTRPPASSTSRAATAEQRIGARQRAVGEPDPQPVGGVAVRHHALEPEAGRDQRRVGLDVGAHHEDVAGLEGRVVVEQADQHLPQHVDLTRGAVARVDLEAAVVGSRTGGAPRRRGRGWRAGRAGASRAAWPARLDGERRGPARPRRRRGPGSARGCHGPARPAAGGGPARRTRRRRARPRRRARAARPRARPRAAAATGARRALAERASSSTSVTGSRVWPKSDSRSGRSSAVAAATQPGHRLGVPHIGRRLPTRRPAGATAPAATRRSSSRVASGAVGVTTLAPVGDQGGPLHGVRRQDAGQPSRDRPAAGPAQLALVAGRPVAEVGGERGRPGLVERRVEHLEQRPDQPVGLPRVVALALEQQRDQRARAEELAPRRRRRRRQRVRRRAGGRAAGTSQRSTPRRRHRDDLGGERVGQRVGEQVGELVGEQVGPRGARCSCRATASSSSPGRPSHPRTCDGDGPNLGPAADNSPVVYQVKRLTPPGPTSSPTMISTTPYRTDPRIRVTMPATTKMTARIQARTPWFSLPLSAARLATAAPTFHPASAADKTR